ncbi:MAG TPA: SH3 domain-containing protein [Verrucomicrobiae bacterium]
MKMPQKLVTLVMCLTTGAVMAQESATVKATRVNVRGQATLNSEVVTQLNQGEPIKVLEQITLEKPGPGEPAKWAKIALPANTPVWVNASFIKDGEVASNRLNVRSGPGENYSVLGRLEKGAKVQAIRTVEEWTEIVAPEGTYAFVSVDFLEIKGAPEIAKTEAKPAEPAGKPAVKVSKTESVEPLPTVKVESGVQPVTRPTAVVDASPVKVMNDAAPVPPPQPVVVATPPPVKPQLDPVTIPIPAPAPAVESPVVVEPAPPQVRIITREGVVRTSLSVQAPSGYRLADPERRTVTVNYLYAGDTGLDLKQFLGRKIRVSGSESVDPRWPNMPLIEIKTLEPIDE